MNTKKAIELIKIEIRFLEKEIEICNPNDDIDAQVIPANKKLIIKYNQIISLLQQGEKWKAIVEDLENNCGYFYYGSSDNLSSIIPKLEQKYFPKE